MERETGGIYLYLKSRIQPEEESVIWKCLDNGYYDAEPMGSVKLRVKELSRVMICLQEQ
jgi:hypothetical protein